MSEPRDPFYELFEYLCRHLVSIVYKHEATRKDDVEGRIIGVASGFIMEFNGYSFLATAGHFMEELEKLKASRPDRRIVVTIVDSFGQGAIDKTMVPLPYFDLPRHFEYDDTQGMDFGLILLPKNTCDLIRANARIPVTEDHWLVEAPTEFASYSIFGVLAEGSHEIGDNGLYLRTAQFDLLPVSNPPNQLMRFTQPMRFFNITNLGDTKTIRGMSGCPIIGFGMEWETKGFRYYFLGIQSGWLPESKIIYACDLATIAKQIIASIYEDQEQGES